VFFFYAAELKYMNVTHFEINFPGSYMWAVIIKQLDIEV